MPGRAARSLCALVFAFASMPALAATRVVVVPIVLSSSGAQSSFFTTELAFTNRGTTDATMTLAYTNAFGGANGSFQQTLRAGAQTIVPDAIVYLLGLGIPVGTSGNRGGTLRVTFDGLSADDAGAVTARTTTAVPGGRAGLAYGGLDPSRLLSAPVVLCGLRQNLTDRSNVAVIHGGAPSDGAITLRLTVVSGDPASPLTRVLPDIPLSPGGFAQISGILSSNGLNLTNAWVKVERVSGTAAFYAYGVVNDQANSDGSFVPPAPFVLPDAIARLTLPAIVETSAFNSELVLTNFGTAARHLVLTYRTSAVPGGSVTLTVDLAPNEQQILTNFVQLLRDRGALTVPQGPTFTGALFVSDSTGDLRGVGVGARTSTPGGGGRYGLFYTAVPGPAEAVYTAWHYGLRQDGENRTNLAFVNTGAVDSTDCILRLDLYDGDTGHLAGTADNVTVPAGGFLQLNGVLSTYAPGVSNGYSRVTKKTGANPYISYTVVNDGGSPGQRSGDGAFAQSEACSPNVTVDMTTIYSLQQSLPTYTGTCFTPNSNVFINQFSLFSEPCRALIIVVPGTSRPVDANGSFQFQLPPTIFTFALVTGDWTNTFVDVGGKQVPITFHVVSGGAANTLVKAGDTRVAMTARIGSESGSGTAVMTQLKPVVDIPGSTGTSRGDVLYTVTGAQPNRTYTVFLKGFGLCTSLGTATSDPSTRSFGTVTSDASGNVSGYLHTYLRDSGATGYYAPILSLTTDGGVPLSTNTAYQATFTIVNAWRAPVF
jgi:hypothetical protein